MDKDKIINKKKRQLNKILKTIPDDKRAIGESLVDELVFMTGTLVDLKENIAKNGVVDFFKQGAQEFYRESPALKSYNNTLNRYSQLYKQLVDLLPKTDNKPAGGDLLDFISE